MLLIGMNNNFTTYPIPPIMANPNAHDWAIFLNSILYYILTCNIWLLANLYEPVWISCEFFNWCHGVFDLLVHFSLFFIKLTISKLRGFETFFYINWTLSTILIYKTLIFKNSLILLNWWNDLQFPKRINDFQNIKRKLALCYWKISACEK